MFRLANAILPLTGDASSILPYALIFVAVIAVIILIIINSANKK